MGAPKLENLNRNLQLKEVLEALISYGWVSLEEAKAILVKRKNTKLHPLVVLAQLNLKQKKPPYLEIGIESLSTWLADYAGFPYFEIDPLKIDIEACTSVLPKAFIKRLKIIPVEVNKDSVLFATAEPFDRNWVMEVETAISKRVEIAVTSPLQIDHFIEEFFTVHKAAKSFARAQPKDNSFSNPDLEKMLGEGRKQGLDQVDSNIGSICDWLLQFAYDERATDIHIEPRKGKAQIRFRIDGKMRVVYKFEPEIALPIVSRFKLLGHMKVDEKRRPQDGRIKRPVGQNIMIEMRLSTIPTHYGEKLVIRIFDPKMVEKTMDELGYYDHDIRTWNEFVSHSYGLVLVTGPTGSGKSTTLHSTLKRLANDAVNICTVEDPVEIINDSFNQMQVNAQIGLTFASSIRSFLRQDPDIIMVGEIRDKEGGEMAIQASLTGHLVLSTLHTNDALSAVTRLIDIGVPAHLINASLRGILAQRLVRVLCKYCKEQTPCSTDLWKTLVGDSDIKPPATTFKANGCRECKNTGYNGRVCIYEMVPYSSKIKNFVNDQVSLEALKELTKGEFVGIRLNGARKVLEGVTSVEEVIRVAF